MKYIKLFENFDRTSIDDICKKYRIYDYTINEDGSIDVDGDVELSDKKLHVLPLKFGKVTGNFYCSSNRLTSLENSPTYVGGSFMVGDNKLVDLEDCPTYIGGAFDCCHNQLTSLNGCPTSINRYFNCGVNKLTNLIGCPSTIGEHFHCFYNNLTSFEGSPTYVGGLFKCDDNKFKTLLGFNTDVKGRFITKSKLDIIYDILKNNIECIPNFYDFHILDNLDDDKPTLNLKRLNRFIELYDLEPLTEELSNEIKKYYIVI